MWDVNIGNSFKAVVPMHLGIMTWCGFLCATWNALWAIWSGSHVIFNHNIHYQIWAHRQRMGPTFFEVLVLLRDFKYVFKTYRATYQYETGTTVNLKKFQYFMRLSIFTMSATQHIRCGISRLLWHSSTRQHHNWWQSYGMFHFNCLNCLNRPLPFYNFSPSKLIFTIRPSDKSLE